MLTYDLVIRGGTVVDGTGDAPFLADVALQAGRIVAVGEISGGGAEEIDASGQIVTPGFVDVHTHYDGQITWENRLAPSSDHGVTTVIMGNCGVGFAPARQSDHQLVIKLMEGVEDIPEVVMAIGVPWNWETFPEYLDALAARESDIDFAAQLPHSPLRVYVMGERGANMEPPTDHDLSEMRRLAKEALQAGALGITTSRNLSHRFRDGRLAPSVNTEEDEVLALAAGLKDAGTGVFQLIPCFDKPSTGEMDLIRKIAERSSRPVSFTLLTRGGINGGGGPYLAGLDRASSDGTPIRAQFMPRPIGMLFGLSLSYHPFSLNPSYREVANLPLAQKVAAMRTPELRARLLAELPDDPNPFFLSVVKRTDLLFVLGDPPNYLPRVEDSMKARAAALNMDVRELIYDELLQRDGRAILYAPSAEAANQGLDAASELFEQSGTIIGLGDGGAHYGMICDAAYTTFVLAEYVLHRKKLSIEAAIRKLTHDPASAVGLQDRGLLKPGYKADLNVIDLARLRLHAPDVKHDLPAGGRRLSQKSDGYSATIVSGKITYRNGQATGALPGRLVRGARTAANHAATA